MVRHTSSTPRLLPDDRLDGSRGEAQSDRLEPDNGSSQIHNGDGARRRALWHPRWEVRQGREAIADDAFLRVCSALFSAHYGRWGPRGPRPDQPVELPRGQLVELLDSEHSWIVSCYIEGELVGYVIAHTFELDGAGPVAWVTQLVVSEAYRNARLATILLRSIWEFSDYYAWGLVTANPFAVRALEAASRRQVRRAYVGRLGTPLVESLTDIVPYIPGELARDNNGQLKPIVDTSFFVSHNDLPKMRKEAARSDRPWDLGHIEEGEEWFACTFREQDPFPLNAEQWDAVLRSSERAWVDAYERMSLDGRHRWHAHTQAECDWILDATGIEAPASVLDVGCGDGRHSRELASRGLTVVGVDVANGLVSRASAVETTARFIPGDATTDLPREDFDLALCLYDVLGSSPDPEDDDRILENISAALRVGGVMVLSVMNEVPIVERLEPDHAPSTYDTFVAALDRLSPSRTMQDSGDDHNPSLLLRYADAYYRKEQFFTVGDRLPREVVVRDRRYAPSALRSRVERHAFEIVDLLPVQAGAWDRQPALDARDPRAKELLVICRRT